MKQSSVYTWTCSSCGHDFSTPGVGGMTLNHCPECGEPQGNDPQGLIVLYDMPGTTGLFECFDCGHPFGYSTSGAENPHSDPNCPECGSENVGKV